MPQRSLSSTSGISNSRSFHPSHPTLGNHEPTTLFGTILHLPKPFPPHSWEPWSTQIPFHASFLAGPFPPHAWEPWSTQTLFHASFFSFPSFSHPTLGNHEKRQNPFWCFIVSFPKPFPPHSWEPWLHELWLSFPPSQVFNHFGGTPNRCKMKPAPANIYSPEVMAALRSRGGWTIGHCWWYVRVL